MTAGWHTVTLGEACTLQRGFDLPKRQRQEGAWPLISSSGCIDSHTESKVAGPGVVTGRSGSIGSVYYVEKDFWPLNTTLYVKDFHGNDPEFICYLLRSFDLSRFVSGAGVPTLNRNNVHSETVKIPESLPEQKRIVAILAKAFAAIDAAVANTEKNLANARELFESYLNGVFAEAYSVGELVPLSEMSTNITDGDHMPPPKSETGVPFITIRNIDKNTRVIDFSDTFKVPRKYFENLKVNKRPQKGDVLYTVTGSFGIPVIVKNDAEFCFQRHIGLIRPKLNVNSRWLNYLLLSPQVFQQANNGATGTAQKTVSLKVLRNFIVPVIPNSRQSDVVVRLDALSSETQRLESIYQQKLTALAELKQSILQKAFAGELTVQPEKIVAEAVA